MRVLLNYLLHIVADLACFFKVISRIHKIRGYNTYPLILKSLQVLFYKIRHGFLEESCKVGLRYSIHLGKAIIIHVQLP